VREGESVSDTKSPPYDVLSTTMATASLTETVVVVARSIFARIWTMVLKSDKKTPPFCGGSGEVFKLCTFYSIPPVVEDSPLRQ
jgi:hypothetical protein